MADTTGQQVLLAGSGAALGVGIVAGLYATAASSLAVGMGGGVVAAGGAAVSPLLIGALVVVPISLAVDYSSGAMYEYPAAIAILMPPSLFPDEDARNAYFADLEARFRAVYDLRRRGHDAACQWSGCDRHEKEDKAFLAERLGWLAAQRARTSIVGGASGSR